MSTIIVTYKKRHIAQLLAQRVIFMLLICLFIGVQVMNGAWALVVLGAIALYYMGRPCKKLVAKFRGQLPALLVSAEGFIDYTKPYKLGVIPWESVKEINSWSLFLVTKVVRPLLHDPNELLRKEQRILYQWHMTIVMALFRTPFLWEMRQLAVSKQDFLRLLREAKAGTYDFDNLGQHLIEQ